MKTVWLVGAGISQQAGYPLVRDFLNRTFFDKLIIREIVTGMSQHTSDRMLPQVEKWSNISTDLNKLMAEYLIQDDTQASDELNSFILQTLDMVRWYHQDSFSVQYMSAFAQQLLTFNSVVITFNYDTLIEEKIATTYVEHYQGSQGQTPTEPVQYNLCFDGQSYKNFYEHSVFHDYGSGWLPSLLPHEGPIKILKLHGSTSLIYCGRCKNIVYHIAPSSGTARLFHSLTAIGEGYCKWCKTKTDFHILFVPPATDEQFPTWELLDSLWDQAEQELMSADVLVIAGYSLPDEDKRARRLLSKISTQRPHLQVLVVDPFLSDDLRKRYASIFDNPMYLKSSFKELMGILAVIRTDYKELVLNDLEPVAGKLLLSMTGKDAVWEPDVLTGAIPFTSNIIDLLDDPDTPLSIQTQVIFMLAQSGFTEIQSVLTKLAFFHKNRRVRGISARALECFANQTALNALETLVTEMELFETEKSNLPGLHLPSSVSLYACEGINEIAVNNSWLDYSEVIGTIINLLNLFDPDDWHRMRLLSTLQTIIRSSELLSNTEPS